MEVNVQTWLDNSLPIRAGDEFGAAPSVCEVGGRQREKMQAERSQIVQPGAETHPGSWESQGRCLC